MIIKARNKKASFNYDLKERYEAGIVLLSKEIKAIRSGRVNISGSHIKILGSGVYWIGGIIDVMGEDKQRSRKLLLNKKEINKIRSELSEKKSAVVPVILYIKKGKAKLEIAIAKGLKKYDKREVIKKREMDRKELQNITKI